MSQLLKALFVASLVFYAKAYTACSGRRAQMSRDWLDTEYRNEHDYYMEFRHNFAAHSGAKQLESAVTYVLLIPDENEGPYRMATTRSQPDAVLSVEEERKFASLIRHAIGKVDDKYNKCCLKLIDNAVSVKGEAFWKEAAESGKTVQLDLPAS